MTQGFAHIAVCVDGSEASQAALSEATRLAAFAEKVSIVHALAPPSFAMSLAVGLGGAAPHDPEPERAAAKAWLESEAREIPNASPVLLEGQPAHAVSEWAEDASVDLLVTASHSGELERALLGSFAAYLAHHAPCPVLLVRPPEGAGS
jgi:nucleotide-binding universal stress UspA family protein